jgi:predicted nicotinamide N-methyase
MSYLQRRGLRRGVRVMEVGCGWGLASIFCSQRFEADVTAVDVDGGVFPFLRLHANLNRAHVKGLCRGFAGLTKTDLGKIDVLIGSDICFWPELREELRKLILRALGAGVRRILISDPGRGPFEELAEYFVHHRYGTVSDWSTDSPRPFQGRVLEITDAERRRGPRRSGDDTGRIRGTSRTRSTRGDVD